MAQRLGAVGKQPRHLGGGFEPRIPRRELGGGEGVARDGREQAVARVVLRVGEPDGVGRDRRQLMAAGVSMRRFAPSARDQLDVEVVGPGLPGEPVEQRRVVGQHGETGTVDG